MLIVSHLARAGAKLYNIVMSEIKTLLTQIQLGLTISLIAIFAIIAIVIATR